MTPDNILADVDMAIRPGAKTAEEALEFLEELQDGIEARIDALRDDLS